MVVRFWIMVVILWIITVIFGLIICRGVDARYVFVLKST